MTKLFVDNYRHKGLRRKLIEELKQKGISDENVLAAINKVPRHWFIDGAFLEEFAYEDKPFQIGEAQTISQPSTVAFQTQLLNVKPGDRILEIGTGSGYQTSVLLAMGAKVFTIERHKSLYENAKKKLNLMGFHPKFFHGDGYLGLPSFAPFDKIIVTAAAPYIPESLKQQLSTQGGILVIPVGQANEEQIMTVVKRNSETDFEINTHGFCKFVPMLMNKA